METVAESGAAPDAEASRAASSPGPRGALAEVAAMARARSAMLVAYAGDGLLVVATAGDAVLAEGVALAREASAAYARVEGERPVVAALGDAAPLDRLARGAGVVDRVIVGVTVGGAVRGLVEAASPEPLEAAEVALAVAERRPLLADLLERGRRPAVLVCHGDGLVAGGVAHLLQTGLGASVRLACGAPEALAAVAARPPDLVVCADGPAAGGDLVAFARALREAGTAAPLLALVRADSPLAREQALEAGATGYLPLALAPARLSATAAALLAGRSALAIPDSQAQSPRLTRREYDVLVASERGLSQQQIAGELEIAVSTVKTHARALHRKLEASSRGEALHRARSLGLL